MEFKFRDYQEDIIEEIIAAVTFGSKNIVIDSPPASGKSIIISKVSSLLAEREEGEGNKIVISITITALLDQIAEHLDIVGAEYSILKAGRNKEFKKDCRIQLVQAQTLHARLDKIDLECDYFLMDEVHREYQTARTTDILNSLKPKARIGFSGTCYDQAGFALEGAEMLTTTTTQDLEDKGFLSPIKCYVPKWAETIDFSSVKKSGNDYNTVALDKIINTEKHLQLAIQSMNKLDAKNKKVLVFASGIDQADYFTKLLRDDGFYAESYHSKSKDSKLVLEAFRSNEDYIPGSDVKKEKGLFDEHEITTKGTPVKCLVSINRLGIGFDSPDCNLGVQLRPTAVQSLYIQQIMRLARIHPSKKFSEYLDLGQTVSRFGFHTDHYIPPVRTGDKVIDDKALLNATAHLNMKDLGIVLDDDLEPVDREQYDIKLEELKKSLDIPLEDMNPQQLMDTLNLSDDHKEIITCITYFYEKLHGPNIMPWGQEKPYNPSDYWSTSTMGKNPHFHVHHTMDEYFEMAPDNMKPRWIKALKTRCKNICKKKEGLFRITGFIKYMYERWESENTSIIEYKAVQEEKYRIPEIDIDMDSIPF